MIADPAKCTAKDCWMTPPWILDLVKKVGLIHLDPCANDWNSACAERTFTAKDPAPDNGAQWGMLPDGMVTYVNWPYSQNRAWATMVIDHAAAQSGEAHVIALANASTGTSWFAAMTRAADAICLLDKRVRFVSPVTMREVSGNQWGTAIWYFGSGVWDFEMVFGDHGVVLERAC